MRSRPCTVALLTIAMLLAACGGGDGGGNEELISALEAQGATTEQAECFVDAVGDEQAQLFADNADAAEPPEGLDIDAVLAALDECGIEG